MLLFAFALLAGFDFSCATFHAYLTETELIATYGRENVTSGPVIGADDGPTEGTILFANQEDARVEIAWLDVAAKQSPYWIRVRGEHSRWKTADGIDLGDDLRKIERINQWPFRLAGFANEMHGTVQNWGRGRLGNEAGSLCEIRIIRHK